MSNLTSFDWWLATYLVAAGFGYAFYIGQLIVKLLLIRFASDKRIDDGLWRLGSLLENGYTVTGESACASPENFDPEIGRKITRQNAIAKIWPLEGYLLKQQLHEVK